MRILFALLCAAGTISVAAHSGSAPPVAAAPSIGDPAPAFELPGSDGRTYRLADYRGKQAVVLAWFAKAFTNG